MNLKNSEKLTYITPQADIIDIEYSDVICVSPGCTNKCLEDSCQSGDTCTGDDSSNSCDTYCIQVAYSN